jgi:hypothetical protein
MKKFNFVDGVEHLHGNFYKVPFASITTTDRNEESDNYVFSNPRLLTKTGTDVLVDKDLSKNLRENIKTRTLLTPFICRWVLANEIKIPQLVGGDRRYRAIDYLISKKEMVADPRTPEGSAVSADIAYEYVVCQVFDCENDLEAAALSWAENKNRVDLTEGHEISAVMELRAFDAPDDQIMEILQKDSKWLHETDELIIALKNDEETLSLFCEDKIKRGAVKKLLEIDNLEERASIRSQAMQMAEVVFEEKNQKIKKQKDAILNKKSRAETKKVFAEATGNENLAEQAQKVLNRIKEREKDIENDSPSAPLVTRKQVEKATEKNGIKDSSRKLGNAKTINSVIETIQDIIGKEGLVDFLEEDFQLDIGLLELIKMVLENHALNNSSDFGETLNDWRKKYFSEDAATFVDDDEDTRQDDEEEEEEDEDEDEDENYGRQEESDSLVETDETEDAEEKIDDDDDDDEESYGDDVDSYYDERDEEELLDNSDDEEDED